MQYRGGLEGPGIICFPAGPNRLDSVVSDYHLAPTDIRGQVLEGDDAAYFGGEYKRSDCLPWTTWPLAAARDTSVCVCVCVCVRVCGVYV